VLVDELEGAEDDEDDEDDDEDDEDDEDGEDDKVLGELEIHEVAEEEDADADAEEEEEEEEEEEAVVSRLFEEAEAEAEVEESDKVASVVGSLPAVVRSESWGALRVGAVRRTASSMRCEKATEL